MGQPRLCLLYSDGVTDSGINFRIVLLLGIYRVFDILSDRKNPHPSSVYVTKLLKYKPKFNPGINALKSVGAAKSNGDSMLAHPGEVNTTGHVRRV